MVNPLRNGIYSIVPLLVLLVGLVAAIWLGQGVAEGDFMPILLAGAVIIGTVCIFGFRQHIWVLIPLCWPIAGSISVLPLPFSIRELGVLIAFFSYLLLYATKKANVGGNRMEFVDLLVWINLGYIGIIYMLHPVGVSFMGSEQVGGRPYLVVAIGFLAYLLMSRIRMTGSFARSFLLVMIIPGTAFTILGFLSQIFPFLVPVVAPFYSGLNVDAYVEELTTGEATGGFDLQFGRYRDLGSLGLSLVSVAVCYWNPKTMLSPMYFARFSLLCFSAAMVFMGGFRNMFFTFAITLLIASFIYEKGLGLLRTAMLGFVLLAGLIALQGYVELPFSAQRSLSFLPGSWNPEVVQGAQESTDWRVDMWRIALTTDKYIKDKVFGDGFGFSAKELELMQGEQMGEGGYLDADNHSEAFMIQGSFHSGPVSSIRFVGVVGLILYLITAFFVLFYSCKLLRQAWDSPFRYMAISNAISAIMQPFFFVFIFGDYRSDLPGIFFKIGMLKLISNSLKDYVVEEAAKQAPTETAPIAAVPTRA